MKRKIYLDSSMIGWSLNKRQAERCAEANLLLAQVSRGLFVGGYSWVMAEEIDAAPEKVRVRLWGVVKHSGLVEVPSTCKTDAVDLANRYMKYGILSSACEADAMHIAIATIWGSDALVSYNFEHIVNLETMLSVNALNKKLGYKEVLLCQPSEVLVNE